jgi:hypothetical protein
MAIVVSNIAPALMLNAILLRVKLKLEMLVLCRLNQAVNSDLILDTNIMIRGKTQIERYETCLRALYRWLY